MSGKEENFLLQYKIVHQKLISHTITSNFDTVLHFPWCVVYAMKILSHCTTLYRVIAVDASVVHTQSALDIEKGELIRVLLLFVPITTHVAYAKRSLPEFMVLCRAISNIRDALIKHMHCVLDTEKNKLAELLISLVPVIHVAYAGKTLTMTMISYCAVKKIKDALIEHMKSVLNITKEELAKLLHLFVPVTHVVYAKKILSKTVVLYHADKNINDALIERMHSVLDTQKGKPEKLPLLLVQDTHVAYVNETLSKIMVLYHANIITVIKDASIEHMHGVLDIKQGELAELKDFLAQAAGNPHSMTE